MGTFLTQAREEAQQLENFNVWLDKTQIISISSTEKTEKSN